MISTVVRSGTHVNGAYALAVRILDNNPLRHALHLYNNGWYATSAEGVIANVKGAVPSTNQYTTTKIWKLLRNLDEHTQRDSSDSI
jgi:hypothetical protein